MNSRMKLFDSCILVFFGLMSVSTGFFFDSKVCYQSVGCFSKSNPFNNSLGELPDSPHEIKIRTFLWTKDNPTIPQELNYLDLTSISDSTFDAARPTKILIHGFMSSKDASPAVANLSVAFLKKYDYNVIGVDWSEGAKKFYPKSVANTRVVGAAIANLVNTLVNKFGLKLRNLHVIGHSLGAHAAGYVGRRVPGIARITGLDPAGPMFTGTHPDVRLDSTDAIFVDAIHSDGGPLSDAGFGTLQPMGHADFYPNGGTQQPGCPPPVKTTLEQLLTLQFSALDPNLQRAFYINPDISNIFYSFSNHFQLSVYAIDTAKEPVCEFQLYLYAMYSDEKSSVSYWFYTAAFDSVSCSHDRAIWYFIESVEINNCHFPAFPCTSWSQFKGGNCSTCRTRTCPDMGINSVLSNANGTYYLSTLPKMPFCMDHALYQFCFELGGDTCLLFTVT